MMKVKGFSLIEVIIVIVLIGIIAVTVGIRSTGTTSLNLAGSAQTLGQDIQLTQILAMSYNQPYQIQFSQHSYQIVSGKNTPYVHPSGQVISLSNEITIKTSNNPLIFDAMGQLISANGNPLSKDASITLNSTQDKKTLRIINQTGFVIQ